MKGKEMGLELILRWDHERQKKKDLQKKNLKNRHFGKKSRLRRKGPLEKIGPTTKQHQAVHRLESIEDGI